MKLYRSGLYALPGSTGFSVLSAKRESCILLNYYPESGHPIICCIKNINQTFNFSPVVTCVNTGMELYCQRLGKDAVNRSKQLSVKVITMNNWWKIKKDLPYFN